MKLPNPRMAVVDIRKLRDYCLNIDHPRGQHKARVFASALGFAPEDAEELRDTLLAAAGQAEAALKGKDEHGERYVVECKASGPRGEATVRSVWIIRRGESFPRLLTCYVV